MKEGDYNIRQMSRDELDIAVEWAANEGWNPGLDDAEVFWQTDPEGFISLEKNGEVIGSGSIVSYNGEFGFMGFFIVKKEYRSKGLGTKLWYYRRDKLLSRLKKGTAIGMDGVFDMQDFYAKGGFKFSHRNSRMESVAKKEDYDEKVTEVGKSDFKEIAKFDKRYFGFDREVFLKGWLNLEHGKAFKYVDGSEIKGYGVVRECREGFKIGPLFAVEPKVAEELYKALASIAEGKAVYLDVPEVNEDAMKLSVNHNMKESFGTARMYYGKAPDLPWDQIYGVTTFELG